MPWGVVATAAVAAYGSYEDQKQKEKDSKDNKEMSELGFQRQAWLDQQQRKWNLEDRKYKEEAVGGFRDMAPDSAKTFNGKPVQSPAYTDTSAGLMGFDPNKPGSINASGQQYGGQQFGLPDDAYMKPKPLMMGG